MKKQRSSVGLHLSDLHLGERVKSEQVMETNLVTQEVLRSRLRFTVSNALHLLRDHVGQTSLSTFHLCLGGDMVSGERHPEHAESNDLTLMEQYHMAVEALWSDALLPIHSWCLERKLQLHVHCVPGNHGQIGEHQAKEMFGRNLDWAIYHQLAQNARQEKSKAKWSIPDGLWDEFEMEGRLFRLMHGHLPGKGIGGRGDGPLGPAGPIMRLYHKMARQARSVQGRRPFDTLVCGHYHHYFSTDEVIANGSIVGYNEFAMGLGFPYQPPVQALWLVHPRFGLTHQLKVHCTPEGSTLLEDLS